MADGGDVAHTDTGRRLVATAVEEFGGLDVLVNSAGVLRDRMIFNMAEEGVGRGDPRAPARALLDVPRAAAYFREQCNPGGHYRIVNFTSHSGLEGSPGQANYAAAKMGVVGLTYSLAQGLARYGVTANAIAPAAATRLVATVAAAKRAIQDRPADDDPSRSPDNIAALALYLASDRSDWLSGRVLGSVGFSVGVYENPTVVGEVTWALELRRHGCAAGAQGPLGRRRPAAEPLRRPGRPQGVSRWSTSTPRRRAHRRDADLRAAGGPLATTP